MGVEAQNDFGGHQTFARKMTSWKAIGFFVQIKVISKKKGLHGFMNMKLPEILTQNRQNSMKLPEILTRNRHLITKPGG